jgi:hypothetical protein
VEEEGLEERRLLLLLRQQQQTAGELGDEGLIMTY